MCPFTFYSEEIKKRGKKEGKILEPSNSWFFKLEIFFFFPSNNSYAATTSICLDAHF